MQAPIPQPRLQPNAPQVPLRAPKDSIPPEEPFVRRAPLTTALIAANVLIFALELWHAARLRIPENTGSLYGLWGIPSPTLAAFGGNVHELTLQGQVERLVASTFLHGDLLHVAFNMVVLRQVGSFLERTVTATRLIPLYLLSGIGGSLASLAIAVISGGMGVSVGASGAICGLIAAALVTGYRIEGPSSPIVRSMGRWLLVVVVWGLSLTMVHRASGGRGGIDNAAHIGGAIAGAIVAMLWRRGQAPSPFMRLLAIASFLGIVGGTAVAVVIRDASTPAANERGPSR